MRAINKPVIIFSVYRADKSNQLNKEAHVLTTDYLRAHGISYIESIGVYNGSKELSIVIDAEYSPLVRKFVQLYQQECYLYLDADRNATLFYSNGTFDKLGVFKAVDNSWNGDYTQNVAGGVKYAVVKS